MQFCDCREEPIKLVLCYPFFVYPSFQGQHVILGCPEGFTFSSLKISTLNT